MTAPLPQSAATALWVLHHCPDRRDNYSHLQDEL